MKIKFDFKSALILSILATFSLIVGFLIIAPLLALSESFISKGVFSLSGFFSLLKDMNSDRNMIYRLLGFLFIFSFIISGLSVKKGGKKNETK